MYYAAIKGGANINGFSSVNNDTSIEEHFTVSPSSKVLDYRILKSYNKDNIYIVEIEALVGNINKNSKVCNITKPIIVKEFRGENTIVTNVPAKYDFFGKNIINLISSNLQNIKNISYFNYKNEYYNFNESNFDLSYDYKTLVNGSQDVKYGDFIYIPKVKISKSKVYPITYLIRNKKITKRKIPVTSLILMF